MNGNWVINKNNRVSFCAVGADNALVYLNHSMKVCGGLVGIAQNENRNLFAAITLLPQERIKVYSS